jgi:hypothetical protein
MNTSKQSTKNSKSAPKKKNGSTSGSTEIRNNELRIKYSDSYDLLHKLHTAAQYVSSKHTHQLLAHEAGKTVKGRAVDLLSSADIPDLLGPGRAYTIVTGCAGEQDPNTKLGDIPGLDLLAFQRCVQKGVISAGYKPGPIPASASNTLDDVITAIEGCSA